jgi:uncharacterized protein (TIGR02246 family)
MTDGSRIARAVLDRLEEAIAAKDMARVEALCTDDVVLFGTSATNVDGEASRRYLAHVVEANATLRWFLDPIVVVHHDDRRLLVAGVGEAEFDEGDGPQRVRFRLSLSLVRAGEAWRIAHFHGSMPAGD